MQLQLETPVIEVPSDIFGVIFTPYDEAGAWKIASMKN